MNQGACPQLFAILLFSFQIHIWVYQGAWEHIAFGLTIESIKGLGGVLMTMLECRKLW